MIPTASSSSLIAPLLTSVQKKPQTKAKPSKGFTQNVRAGDWVCLRCKNLNFAFRNECNRCQLQIKDQHRFQALYPPDKSSSKENIQNREAFKDLTNVRSPPAPNLLSESSTQDRSMDSQKDLNDSESSNNDKHILTEAKIRESLKANMNRGFNNVLLVTPPKTKQSKSLDFLQEELDWTQNELPPYRSPDRLPPVTRMLQEFFIDLNSNEAGKRKQKSLSFLEEKAKREGKKQEIIDSYQLVRDSNFFSFEK